MTHFEVGSKLSPPNVIILNAGDPLSNDSAVDKCLRMYLTEIGMENNGNINVVADEAIFRRGISYCKTNQKTKMILGQWHTNKDMMMTLITIFSGYGIFNMAGILGGIFNLQHESLKAFSPLFPVAGKSNYARSITYHIYCIENDPLLRKMLHIAPSVNLTSPGHFFAYDEALEIFEVTFVKQNVIRIPTDGEELKLKIKATQLEKERTEMLILNQEILLTEHYTTVGRRARNIIRVTVADITKMKKEKKIEMREEKEKEKRKGRERGRERGSESGRGSGKGSGTRKRRRRK
ncbi:uncharacterized protein OCT59_000804 [Rhizophagus irregularis]|uniref:uncharacterized protein n=1 Tax=Rhizophagus irregularis TaxID=588596 RepID=UPI00332F74DA|nr:hypothetical protein OCT59_000804 [Rhizophagus irregularis]